MADRKFIQERLTDVMHNPGMAQAIAQALCDPDTGAGYANLPEPHLEAVAFAASRQAAKEEGEAASGRYSASLRASPSPAPTAIPAFRKLDNFLNMLLDGDTTKGAIIYGSAGIGKSHRVQAKLTDRGVPFTIYNSYSTPLAFYELLWQNRDGTVVLDDVNTLLRDPKAVAIMKAALYSVGSERLITYSSTSKVLEERGIPSRFIFNGRIILILNEIPRGMGDTFQALLSRVYALEVQLSISDKTALIRSVLAGRERFVGLFCSRAMFANEHRFNLRTALQCAELYARLPEQDALELMDEVLDLEPRHQKFLAVEKSAEGKPVEYRAELFTKLTGYSRREYFNIKSRFYRAQYGKRNAALMEVAEIEGGIR